MKLEKPTNTLGYFEQYSNDNINKLLYLSDFIKDKLEIEPLSKNGEYFYWFPYPIIYSGDFSKDEIDKLLNKSTDTYNFCRIDTKFKDDLNAHVFITNKDNFLTFYKKLKTYTEKVLSPLVEYNSETGDGSVNGKVFKIRSKVHRRIFTELFENANKEIVMQKIIELAGGKEAQSSAKYFINDLAKKLRIKTHLNNKQLVLVRSNLMLLCRAISAPK